MHLSGSVNVKDSTVRRAASIGILADGSTDPDGTKHRVRIDGNYSTSRVEQNSGVGIQLEGASHEVRNTYVANIGTAFAIKGNNGVFLNNACKSEKTGGGYLVTGTSNTFSTNSAEKNKGSEWVIAAGNVDLGSNRKNGKTFPFTTAGGTFE